MPVYIDQRWLKERGNARGSGGGGDDSGAKWVALPQKKRRRSPRALRFAELKVGDQLMRRWPHYTGKGSDVWYYVVTDLWFDPVAGQTNELAGRMVAICRLGPDGNPRKHKEPHTLRGLASQGFRFANVDYAAHAKAAQEGVREGAAVGIGQAHVIRRRPKLPSQGL